MAKLFLLTALFLLIALPALARGKDHWVVLGYSAEWYDDRYPPARYDLKPLTHIARSFLEPKADGSLKIPPHFFDPVLAQRCKEKGVKLLASIGGESAGDNNWKAIAADPGKTKRFLDAVEKEVKGRDWDGVDIDWEPGPQTDKDQALYAKLLRALRQRFPHWTLTTALMAGESWVAHIPWDEVMKDVDFVNLMTYPLAGPWTGHSAHQTNLYPSKLTPGDGEMSVDGLVRNLLEKYRVPPSKIVLGLVFWAMKFPTEHLGDKLGKLSPGDMGGYSYAQMPDLEKDKDYQKQWDEKAAVPYLQRVKGGHAIVSYDDERSIGLKVDYAKKKKLGGVMFWHMGSDVKDGGALLQTHLAGD